MSGDTRRKQALTYPCRWLYKIIGRDRESLQQAIAKSIGRGKGKVTFSNISNKGNYIALNVELTVYSEQERDKIYHSLKSDPAVKIVI